MARSGTALARRPETGQAATAQRLRELLGQDAARPGARIQDPYGLRTLPQVHGAAADALGDVERVLATELNAAAENPLIDVTSGQVLHNGNFHGAYLALDTARLAVSGARLRQVYERCRERLSDTDEDHPLDTDIAAAEQVIADLAASPGQ